MIEFDITNLNNFYRLQKYLEKIKYNEEYGCEHLRILPEGIIVKFLRGATEKHYKKGCFLCIHPKGSVECKEISSLGKNVNGLECICNVKNH